MRRGWPARSCDARNPVASRDEDRAIERLPKRPWRTTSLQVRRNARPMCEDKNRSRKDNDPAQPVLATHYWLCYCEKLERDRGRLAGCRARTNVLSLGAAAVAGTSLPIDREDVARRLGFGAVAANSRFSVAAEQS